LIFFIIKGNWKYNKMDGYGKLYYQSGKIAYEGNWADDQFQGLGKIFCYYKTGKLYNEQPD
jgi:antitoxin component YwqK of YwqJK toxin-antitoxin module